jgi:acetolactate synthase I/II/III large subunit
LTPAGQLVAQWMAQRDLTHFFHVPGESFLPILDALRDGPTKTVTNRHESGAVFAAEAFAKVVGRPAVCMATRGPGAANLTIGVQTASYDGSPLLALVGMVPTAGHGGRAFQDFDLAAVFGSVAKRAFMVNRPDALSPTLNHAYEIAIGGRPGPVVVGIPTDVIYSDVPAVAEESSCPSSLGAFDDDHANRVMKAISSAQSPALLVATEAVRGRCANALAEFAAKIALPVFAAWRRYSAFDNTHPCFVGSIGLGGWPDVAGALSQADLIVAFGFALEQITVQTGSMNRRGVTIIQIAPQIDPDGVRLATPAQVLQICADPTQAAERLVAWCDEHREMARTIHAKEHLGTRSKPVIVKELEPVKRTEAVDLEFLMSSLNSALPADAIITSDAGNFAHWLLRFVKFDRSRTYVGALNGAMGYGLPAAIGAELAAPGRPCWSICGDGGLLMVAGEMETAKRLGLNTTVIVINNKSFGSIRAKQERDYPGRVAGTDLGDVDFTGLASAMGWKSWKVRRHSEVNDALAQAGNAAGCRLIEVIPNKLPFGLS